MAKHKIDEDHAADVGGLIIAMRLAQMPDLDNATRPYLDRLADIAVEASLALKDAIPRARERLAAEAKAEEEAEERKIAEEDAAMKAAEQTAKGAKVVDEKATDAKAAEAKAATSALTGSRHSGKAHF